MDSKVRVELESLLFNPLYGVNFKIIIMVHRALCDHFEVSTCDKPWLHTPQPVTMANNVKILWDFDIRTDRLISAQRPDIVVVNSNCWTGILIDVAIPADANTVSKETEKIAKINIKICVLSYKDFGT